MVLSKNSSWRHFEMKEKKKERERIEDEENWEAKEPTANGRDLIGLVKRKRGMDGWTGVYRKGRRRRVLPVSEWHDVGWDGRMGGYFGAG
jgi:hypothetical protein